MALGVWTCAHPPELCALVSHEGLLHPEAEHRTTLRRVLELYGSHLDAPPDGLHDDGAGGEAPLRGTGES